MVWHARFAFLVSPMYPCRRAYPQGPRGG